MSFYTQKEIIAILKENKSYLKEKFHVKRIALFDLY